MHFKDTVDEIDGTFLEIEKLEQKLQEYASAQK